MVSKKKKPGKGEEKAKIDRRTGEEVAEGVTSRAVFVLWTDAAGTTGWTNLRHLEDTAGAVDVLSVGFVLKEEKDQIILVQSVVGETAAGDNTIAIPKGMIKQIWEIDSDLS